jgi:uncharacterized protein YukE
MPTINPKALEDLARDFDTYASTFEQATRDIGATTVAAGSFTEATMLSNRVSARAKSLDTAVTNIHKALTTIASNLRTNATVYADAERDNTGAGEQIEMLLDDLQSDLPGFRA